MCVCVCVGKEVMCGCSKGAGMMGGLVAYVEFVMLMSACRVAKRDARNMQANR